MILFFIYEVYKNYMSPSVYMLTQESKCRPVIKFILMAHVCKYSRPSVARKLLVRLPRLFGTRF